MSKSWMCKFGICQDCDYEVVVIQGKESDYRYYCSNPDCPNHLAIEDIGDQEHCSFIKRKQQND